MPRSNIGRRTRRTRQQAARRNNEDEQQRTQRNESNRQQSRASRMNATDEQRAERIIADRIRTRQNRARMSDANRAQQNLANRTRSQLSVSLDSIDLNRLAFRYNHETSYSSHTSIQIGTMTQICGHCKALKFSNEAPGSCCASGKVKLPPLQMPPALIISACSPANPIELWNKYKDSMADDILHRMRNVTDNRQLIVSTEMHNEALVMIEDICLMISSKSLV